MWDLCSKVNDLFSVNVWNTGTKKLSTDTNLTRQFQSIRWCVETVLLVTVLNSYSTETGIYLTREWGIFLSNCDSNETLCHGTRLSHAARAWTLVCLCLKCLSPTKGFCRNPHSGNSPTQLFSTGSVVVTALAVRILSRIIFDTAHHSCIAAVPFTRPAHFPPQPAWIAAHFRSGAICER